VVIRQTVGYSHDKHINSNIQCNEQTYIQSTRSGGNLKKEQNTKIDGRMVMKFDSERHRRK